MSETTLETGPETLPETLPEIAPVASVMTLEQLKVRMQLSLDDTSKDATYQAWLDDAVEIAQEKCGVSFETKIPSGVRRAIVLLVKGMNESNVASQSLGDMSKSFFKTDYYKEAMDILDGYVGYDEESDAVVGPKQVKFYPLGRGR